MYVHMSVHVNSCKLFLSEEVVLGRVWRDSLHGPSCLGPNKTSDHPVTCSQLRLDVRISVISASPFCSYVLFELVLLGFFFVKQNKGCLWRGQQCQIPERRVVRGPFVLPLGDAQLAAQGALFLTACSCGQTIAVMHRDLPCFSLYIIYYYI